MVATNRPVSFVEKILIVTARALVKSSVILSRKFRPDGPAGISRVLSLISRAVTGFFPQTISKYGSTIKDVTPPLYTSDPGVLKETKGRAT